MFSSVKRDKPVVVEYENRLLLVRLRVWEDGPHITFFWA